MLPPQQSAEATLGRSHISYAARNTCAYLETQASARAANLWEQGGIILPTDHVRSPRSGSGYAGGAVLHDGAIFCLDYAVDDAPVAPVRGNWFDGRDV